MEKKFPEISRSISRSAAFRLEALRGFAAVIVAVFHSLVVVEDSVGDRTGVSEALFLFNGRAAVTLFFVLSGFVLSLSLGRAEGPAHRVYWGFAIRRFLRIYPALIASSALVLIILWIHSFKPFSSPSAFVSGYFPSSVTWEKVILNLFLVEHDLNNVTWTLRMEIFGSMLLPPIWFISRKYPKFLILFLFFSVTANLLFPAVISFAVLPAFIIGLVTTQTEPFWKDNRFGSFAACLCIIVGGAFLLSAKPITVSLGLPFSFSYFPEAFGAGLLISSLAYGPETFIGKELERPSLRWVGRVSYSYYLLHPVALILLSFFSLELLISITRGQHLILCAGILWIGSSLIAFPFAALFYQFIEKPFIKKSQSLNQRDS